MATTCNGSRYFLRPNHSFSLYRSLAGRIIAAQQARRVLEVETAHLVRLHALAHRSGSRLEHLRARLMDRTAQRLSSLRRALIETEND